MTKTRWVGLAVALAVGPLAWLCSPDESRKAPPTAPNIPAQMVLMRRLEVVDLGRVYTGEPTSVLGPADAFVYGHDGIYEDQVSALVLDGKKVHRYFNVLQAPRPEWVNPRPGLNEGSRWFDFGWKVIHLQWGAVVKDSLGIKARFQWFGQTFVYDWSVIGPARADSIVAVQIACLGDASDVFLDQIWLTPKAWFFRPESPAFGDITPAETKAWKANLLYYIEAMRKAVAAKAGSTVILNGDPEAPPPIFLENAEWTWYWGSWRAVVERWKKHPGNVLEVTVGSGYEDSLLAAWMARRGGTIGVKGTIPATQSFYGRAALARATLGTGPVK